MSKRILKRKSGENAFLKKRDEDQARALVGILNAPEEREPEEVHPQLRELKAMVLSLSGLQRKSLNREIFNHDEVNPINEVLARHKLIFQYVAWDTPGGYTALSDILVPADKLAHEDSPLGLARHNISTLPEWIIEFERAGLLDRVRCCDYCQEWFFAKSHHRGFFCSSQHQQAAHKSTPEFKEKARKYQKQYYRDILSPVTGRWKAKRNRRKASS